MMLARGQPALTAFLLLAAQSMHEGFLIAASEIHQEASLPFFPLRVVTLKCLVLCLGKTCYRKYGYVCMKGLAP